MSSMRVLGINTDGVVVQKNGRTQTIEFHEITNDHELVRCQQSFQIGAIVAINRHLESANDEHYEIE